MKMSTSAMLRAVERVMTSMLSDSKREVAVESSDGLMVRASRMEKAGFMVGGMTYPQGGRKWIELRVEVDE